MDGAVPLPQAVQIGVLASKQVSKNNFVVTEIAQGEPLKVPEITSMHMDAKLAVTPLSIGSAGNRQKAMQGETSLEKRW